MVHALVCARTLAGTPRTHGLQELKKGYGKLPGKKQAMTKLETMLEAKAAKK